MVFSTISQCYDAAFLLRAMYDVSVRIAGYTRIALDKWVASQDYILRSACSRCDSKVFFGFTKQLGNKHGRTKVPLVSTVTGKRSESYTEDRLFLQEYFCKLFSGKVGSFSDLIDKDREIREVLAEHVPLPEVDLRLFPSMHDLAVLLSHRPAYKGIGEDRIGSEVLRAFSGVIAQILHPLAVKSFGLIETPISFEGGQISALDKGAGPLDNPTSSRDITVASEIGKAIAKVTRGVYVEQAEEVTHDCRFGSGLHHGSTEFAHLYIKATIDHACSQTLSVAVLFFDVRTAFASMISEFLLVTGPTVIPDDHFEQCLRSKGFQDQQIHDILFSAEAAYKWTKARGSNHSYQVLSNMYTATWASTEGLSGVYEIGSGSLAGTTHADLVFAFAVASVFDEIRTELESTNLLTKLDESLIEDIFGLKLPISLARALEVLFVDDSALSVLAPSLKLVDKVREVVVVVDSVFSKFGLELNYKPGKSEALIVFVGRDSYAARVKLLIEQQSYIIFTNRYGVVKHLVVTDQYKHLGSKVVVSGSLGPEVTFHFGSMYGAFKGVRSKILKNPGIALKIQVLVIKALLYSEALYQASTWKALNISEARRAHMKIIKIWRSLLGLDKPWCEHVSDEQIIIDLEILSPLSFITHLRIKLLFRVCTKVSPDLIIMICNACKNDKFWLATVLHDLNKLASVCDKLERYRDAKLCDWVQLVQSAGNGFNKIIDFAISMPVVNTINFWFNDLVKHDEVVCQGSLIQNCHVCLYSCPSVHGLHWHLYKVHGLRNPDRALTGTTFCEACLREFHHKQRLITHVARSSKRCLAAYRLFACPLEHEVLSLLEA